jgi:hypothetical protein
MCIHQLIPFTSNTSVKLDSEAKTKYRDRLNMVPDLRIQLSNIRPNIGSMCEEKIMTHSSH